MLIGAYLVTYNVIALGGNISFFQSYSVLNYCIFPIFMGVFIIKLLFFFQIRNRIFTFSIMGAAVIWCCLCNFYFIQLYIFLLELMSHKVKNSFQSIQPSFTISTLAFFWPLCEFIAYILYLLIFYCLHFFSK